jgi:hypothetical protein
MSEQNPYHHLFGLIWTDFFDGTPVAVDAEVDLSLRKQYLDLVIIHATPGQPIPRTLPDGFEPLAVYNLVTFKSFQEALDAWALQKLIGHYVNYRKQRSPDPDNLLPPRDFRLFAVCARHPAGLEREGVVLEPVQAGVYDVATLTRSIRVIVVNELPQEDRNAMLHLFSSREELLRYGQQHHRRYSQNTTTLLSRLFIALREDPEMSQKFQQLVREALDEVLERLTPEERLKGLPVEEIRNALPVEERLKGLPAEERLKGLSPEELVRALPPEMLELLAKQLKSNCPGPTAKPE